MVLFLVLEISSLQVSVLKFQISVLHNLAGSTRRPITCGCSLRGKMCQLRGRSQRRKARDTSSIPLTSFSPPSSTSGRRSFADSLSCSPIASCAVLPRLLRQHCGHRIRRERMRRCGSSWGWNFAGCIQVIHGWPALRGTCYLWRGVSEHRSLYRHCRGSTAPVVIRSMAVKSRGRGTSCSGNGCGSGSESCIGGKSRK